MADPYPFPSNVHILSSVTLKLNDGNYLLWKTQFESLLSSQKLIGFVNGGVTSPPTTITVVTDGVAAQNPNPQYEAWFCTDQLVKSWLFGTLSEEVLGYVHNLNTSREVWLSLAENFNQSSLTREFALRQKLQMLTNKGKTFTEYSREFKTLCDALSSIGKPIDESMKIFGFLNGLSKEYVPITTVLKSQLSKLPPPTFKDVVTEIQGFDATLQSYEETTTVTNMAFQAQSSNYRSGSNQFYPRGRGRFGNRGRGGYSTRGRGFPQHQTTQSTNGERPTYQICGRIGHTAIRCYNRFDNNYQEETPKAFAALKTSDDSGKEWYPDSGSTAHITASTENLQNVAEYEGNETIMVADGAFLPITHVGSTKISSSSEGGPKRSST